MVSWSTDAWRTDEGVPRRPTFRCRTLLINRRFYLDALFANHEDLAVAAPRARRSKARDEVVEWGRYLAGGEGVHQETAVADLAALLRAEEAPQLVLSGPTVLGGLVQEGLPGP